MEQKQVTFLLLRGLPGSGKSTYSRELVASGWKRLCKDEMSDMIDGGEFSPENESMLNTLLYEMARGYLERGYNVVSDNMSWNIWHVNMARRVADTVNILEERNICKVAVKDFDTSIEECIRRDALRPKPVTEEVIRKIAAQHIVNGQWPPIEDFLG